MKILLILLTLSFYLFGNTTPTNVNDHTLKVQNTELKEKLKKAEKENEKLTQEIKDNKQSNIYQLLATIIALCGLGFTAWQLRKSTQASNEQLEFMKAEIKNMENTYNLGAAQNSFNIINDFSYGDIRKHVDIIRKGLKHLDISQNGLWTRNSDVNLQNIIITNKNDNTKQDEINKIEESTSIMLNIFENALAGVESKIVCVKILDAFFREIYIDYYYFTKEYISEQQKSLKDFTLWCYFTDKCIEMEEKTRNNGKKNLNSVKELS